MSTAPEYEPRSTVDDYRQWEGRWELWNGFAVATTPSPFGRHAKSSRPGIGREPFETLGDADAG